MNCEDLILKPVLSGPKSNNSCMHVCLPVVVIRGVYINMAESCVDVLPRGTIGYMSQHEYESIVSEHVFLTPMHTYNIYI